MSFFAVRWLMILVSPMCLLYRKFKDTIRTLSLVPKRVVYLTTEVTQRDVYLDVLSESRDSH